MKPEIMVVNMKMASMLCNSQVQMSSKSQNNGAALGRSGSFSEWSEEE